MSIITKARKQKAVFWEKEGVDVYGQPTYSNPVEIGVRWDDTAENFIDENGTVQVSRAEVMVDRVVPVGSLLKLGVLSDLEPETPPRQQGAYEVRQLKQHPNFRATETLRIAIL